MKEKQQNFKIASKYLTHFLLGQEIDLHFQIIWFKFDKFCKKKCGDLLSRCKEIDMKVET